jgi:hypothetical protein
MSFSLSPAAGERAGVRGSRSSEQGPLTLTLSPADRGEGTGTMGASDGTQDRS